MRSVLIGSALALIALPAVAQVSDTEWNNCANPTLTAEARIGACTRLIERKGLVALHLTIAYIDRGIAYDAKGLHDQALADYTKVIALNPDYGGGYNGRAWVYHEKGQNAQALPDAIRAVALAPLPAHFETRGEIYEKLGQRDKAVADYRAALRLDPKDDGAKQGLMRLGDARQ
jgi:tetratricopeptide (TPR) repeat protein